MMHDMYMQKCDDIFLKDLSKLVVNMVEEHDFKRYCNRFVFQNVRTKSRKKFLSKAKA